MRSSNHTCNGKAISITYTEGVFVELGIQHAMRIAPYCHLRPVRLYVSTLSHKPHEFRKGGGVIARKKRHLISCTKFSSDISQSKKKYARYDHNVRSSSRKEAFLLISFKPLSC